MQIYLREKREARQMTIRQLASKSGVSCSQLSKIERGDSEPTFKTMCKIALALRENPWDIFVFDGTLRRGHGYTAFDSCEE